VSARARPRTLWGSSRPSVHFVATYLYSGVMDVAVSDLRAHLSEWLERARNGVEVVVTDRGVPVARLLGMTATPTLERLAAEGVIGRPDRALRTTAAGRSRPRPQHSVSDLVSEHRR
jgi:prevent-host-death family protein